MRHTSCGLKKADTQTRTFMMGLLLSAALGTVFAPLYLLQSDWLTALLMSAQLLPVAVLAATPLFLGAYLFLSSVQNAPATVAVRVPRPRPLPRAKTVGESAEGSSIRY